MVLKKEDILKQEALEDTKRDRLGSLVVVNHAKKILIVTGSFAPAQDGIAKYAKQLKDELPRATRDKVRVIVANWDEVKRWIWGFKQLAYFFKILNRARFSDLVYAQDPIVSGLPAALAASLWRKRFVLRVTGDYAWERGMALYGVIDDLDNFSRESAKYGFWVKFYKKLEAWVAKRAEVIVVPSNYLKKIVSNWQVAPEKIFVIYNSVDRPEEPVNKEVLRQKMQVSGRVMVSVGSLFPWKGYEMLVRIFPDLQRKFSDLKLLIIGDGPERDRLNRQIISADLADSIMLTGNLDKVQMETYLRLADVFVSNSGYEGSPHQLLETAAFETPIIATDVGGNSEFIENKTNGLLVKYNNAEDLKEAIGKILKDKSLAGKLARNAAAIVPKFSKENMLAQLLNEVLLR